MPQILHNKLSGTWRLSPFSPKHRKPADSKTRLKQNHALNIQTMKQTQNPNSPTSLSGTSTDPIDPLEQIANWPANSNSDPDDMAKALDRIQQLANDAVNYFRSQAFLAGTNKELASLLISAASALNHGRHSTARTKVATVYKALHEDTQSLVVLLQHRPIIAGQDTYGPFLMLGDFRCAMPSSNAAHVISHLINNGRSYCGQRDCPCGPVDPPHDS